MTSTCSVGLLRRLVTAHLAARGHQWRARQGGSGAARHLSSAVGQIVNFLGTLQNEWAGARAFSSFDTYLAPPCARTAGYEQVRQCIQELVYNLNVPSRWGTQTPSPT